MGNAEIDTPEVEALHLDLQAKQPLILQEPSNPQERKLKISLWTFQIWSLI